MNAIDSIQKAKAASAAKTAAHIGTMGRKDRKSLFGFAVTL
jgi:hypothetical protein